MSKHLFSSHQIPFFFQISCRGIKQLLFQRLGGVKSEGWWWGQDGQWKGGTGSFFLWITEMKDEAANDDVRALICRLHTHTQMLKNGSHCSSSFLSPFGFLPACCLATRNPTMWLGCDSPGDATSWACSTHVIRTQTRAHADSRAACICACALQLNTCHTMFEPHCNRSSF